MTDRPAAASQEERLRRIVMIVRQGLYLIADGIGHEYGLERPCKACETERRRTAKVVKPDVAA